ncbi:hypothetical protein [Streptomyces sp. NPDC021020]|uniref:hypothetical protein n=1 Tax=Streptomyces sp. NPDC021020 TaxID=3365109 RepID=UPI00378B5ED7
MSAKLDALARLLPPPQENVTAPPWEQSKAACGFDFPSDYREFVNAYGGGAILTATGERPVQVLAPCSIPRRPGTHPASEWLASPALHWTQHSDWLHLTPHPPADPS